MIDKQRLCTVVAALHHQQIYIQSLNFHRAVVSLHCHLQSLISTTDQIAALSTLMLPSHTVNLSCLTDEGLCHRNY